MKAAGESRLDRPTCEDRDSGLQQPVADVLSSVLWLQVLDLQGVVGEAQPAAAPFWFHRTVSVLGEDGLPPLALPLLEPPLFEFGGAAAGEQQRPARGHRVVPT